MLLSTLIVSLPALWNGKCQVLAECPPTCQKASRDPRLSPPLHAVGALLFLLFFIYAYMGAEQ